VYFYLPHLIEYKGVPCTGLFGQLIAEHIVEDAEVIKKWKGSVLFKLPGDKKAICGVCIYQLLAKFEDTKGINQKVNRLAFYSQVKSPRMTASLHQEERLGL
jgi:hypothetical protein